MVNVDLCINHWLIHIMNAYWMIMNFKRLTNKHRITKYHSKIVLDHKAIHKYLILLVIDPYSCFYCIHFKITRCFLLIYTIDCDASQMSKVDWTIIFGFWNILIMSNQSDLNIIRTENVDVQLILHDLLLCTMYSVGQVMK